MNTELFIPYETVFYLTKGWNQQLYKCHVIAVVEEQVVYRWYGKHKQWWHYEIEDMHFLIKIITTKGD